MIYIDEHNIYEVEKITSSIKYNMDEWQLISLYFINDSDKENLELAEKIIKPYEETQGFYFFENNKKAIIVMNMGQIDNYSILKRQMEKNIIDSSCLLTAKKMNPIGLKKIEMFINRDSHNKDIINLYAERERRSQNIVLIVDDDEFIRKSLKSILSTDSEVYEVSHGDEVIPAYKKYNPDVVIMDIHIPPKNGLDLILEIEDFDENPFIIMSSSDSVKENIFEAIARGAIGFLAKPPRKRKIIEYLNQCITYRKAYT